MTSEGFEQVQEQSKNPLVRPIIIVVGLLGFGMLIFFLMSFLNEFFTSFNATGLNDSTIDDFQTNMLNIFGLFDWLIVAFMVAAIFTTGVVGYIKTTPPVFFVLNLILAPLLAYIAYFFNYVFSQYVSESFFTYAYNALPNTLLICTNLHWIALAGIIISSITWFRKKETGETFEIGQ